MVRYNAGDESIMQCMCIGQEQLHLVASCISYVACISVSECCKYKEDAVNAVGRCYDFRQLRQSLTVVVSKVQSQMSLEECKS